MEDPLAHLPQHLKAYVVDQHYAQYTAQDHAVWRYVMRQNRHFLKKVAHMGYLEGLEKTGLKTDTIANMYGMNRILKDIGWAAVAVDGFIPPAVFMEFQAHKVLVIAADIRTIEHLEYTPAPDILHEAAGHAPFIADPEYAAYLIDFGEIGSKAISSEKDYELYEAIRHLSIIKEDPNTTKQTILEAEKSVASIQAHMGPPSEMALLRNLHWWTVEYGLIGTLKDPKIYGAGLLSSISESMNCLKPAVKKIPYSLEAMHYNFDITKPQPHLFVTPDFNHLRDVLNEFSASMDFRKKSGHPRKPNKKIKTETVRITVPREKTHKIFYDERTKELHAQYLKLSTFRNTNFTEILPEFADKVLQEFPGDWLLPLEILELLEQLQVHPATAAKIKQALMEHAKKVPATKTLIQNGLNLIYNTFADQ